MSEFLLYALAVLTLPLGALALSLFAEHQTKRMIESQQRTDRK